MGEWGDYCAAENGALASVGFLLLLAADDLGFVGSL